MPFKIVREDRIRLYADTITPIDCDGGQINEEQLRECYRKVINQAAESGVQLIAIPLIDSILDDFSKEEVMRIVVDEINVFLASHYMMIYLVITGMESPGPGRMGYSDLESYIEQNYVRIPRVETYEASFSMPVGAEYCEAMPAPMPQEKASCRNDSKKSRSSRIGSLFKPKAGKASVLSNDFDGAATPFIGFDERHESKLEERMHHMSDTYSEYLMYLIQERHMENAEVWKRAIVDKKIFSKIKNNVNYHPNKMTALCLCIGAKLNLDESKDLLARAGYALSPCDKTDIIFSYFIENEIYDMIELDIQLEEHGLPCIIS